MAVAFPTLATGSDGSLAQCWLNYNSGSSGPGTIVCQYKGPGDQSFSSSFTFKDSTGASLVSADTTFHISQAWDGQNRWTLSVLIQGETTPSCWWSADDLRTWTRV